jgi:hypothetical protein
MIAWILILNPSSLPFTKGGITPLWQRGVRGDLLNNMSSQLWTPYYV